MAKPPNSVDPGEAWAACTGCEPALTHQLGRAVAGYRDAVLSLPNTIAKLAAQAVAGTIEPEYPEPPNYDRTSEALQRGVNQDEAAGIMARLPDEAQLPYMTVLSRLTEFLSHAFPRSSAETLTGFVVFAPDPLDWYRFAGLYQVVNDPFSVFGLMSAGSLLQNQAHAVRAVYPTLSIAFDDALRTALVNAVAKSNKFEVPWMADAGIRDWLGMETVYRPFQAAFIPPMDDTMGGAPEPSSSGVAPESKSSLSAAQSALYGTVGR